MNLLRSPHTNDSSEILQQIVLYNQQHVLYYNIFASQGHTKIYGGHECLNGGMRVSKQVILQLGLKGIIS